MLDLRTSRAESLQLSVMPLDDFCPVPMAFTQQIHSDIVNVIGKFKPADDQQRLPLQIGFKVIEFVNIRDVLYVMDSGIERIPKLFPAQQIAREFR